MRVLVVGASGFIGSHIARALSRQGHHVIAGVRRPEASGYAQTLTVDFSQPLPSEEWLAPLQDVDAVVNCVGIIAEDRHNRFEDLHHCAPVALFAACAQAGVCKIVQISALGADETAFSRYHLSKKAADDFLAQTHPNWAILQPSWVYGPGGKSLTLFTALAALPVLPLLGDGGQRLQPVHVDDLVEAVLRVLEEDSPRKLAVVGPQAETFAGIVSALRAWLRFKPAFTIAVPFGWVLMLARWVERWIASPFNSEALLMLQQGNTGDAEPLAEVLGRQPCSLEAALAELPAGPPQRLQARLFFLLPLLRVALGLMWVWSGVTSALLYPQADSFALLAQVGITGWAAPLTLYGASLLDAVLGLAFLVGYRVKAVAWAQLAVMLGYSLVIAWRLSEFWLHPFAPLVKNLPLIVATLMILSVEEM